MINYRNIREGSNCVIWTRVSTKRQEDNGGSLDDQKTRCMNFAKDNGLTIKGYYGGKHESAKTPGKMFKEMASAVKKDKNIAYILVTKFDRFSRDAGQAITMLTELRNLGIIVKSVNTGLDTKTKEGFMMASQTLTMAQWDNENRVDTFTNGRINCLSKGVWSERAPRGYKKTGKSINTHCYLDEEGLLIKQAFKWKLRGHTNAQILTLLEARGMKITKQTLHWILTNPFYAGKIQNKLIADLGMIDGEQEKAVSYNDFLRVQDILADKTGRYRHKKEKPECPLSNYIRCSKDDTHFTSYMVKSKGLNYYKCNKVGCKTNVSAKEMHMKFEALLEKFNINDEILQVFTFVIKDVLHEYGNEAEESSKMLRKRLTEVEREIKDCKIRFATGKIDEEAYQAAKEELCSRRDMISLQLDDCQINLSNLESAVPEVVATCSKLESLWHDGDLETKRKVQDLVFPNGIVWDKEKRNYRTTGRNKVFDLIEKISRSYNKEQEQAVLTPVQLYA